MNVSNAPATSLAPMVGALGSIIFYFKHEHREDIFFPLCKILYILLV